MRKSTLRDAKKHGWVPSFSGVWALTAKPGLEVWKKKQLALSMATLPKLPTESEEEFIRRAVVDAEAQALAARELGSDIHKAIEQHLRGEQFDPAFLRISPNNRIPAIVDDAPADGKGPLSIFESGAILTYLAEKTGRLLPSDARGKFEVLQWLFWQVGGLGPMAGQNHHFAQYAPEPIPYAIDRYVKETARLYRVMDTRLADRPYLAGDYSIADIASYPWVAPHEKQRMNLDDFPNLKRWFATIAKRPAVERAYAVAGEIQRAVSTHTTSNGRLLAAQIARRFAP